MFYIIMPILILAAILFGTYVTLKMDKKIGD